MQTTCPAHTMFQDLIGRKYQAKSKIVHIELLFYLSAPNTVIRTEIINSVTENTGFTLLPSFFDNILLLGENLHLLIDHSTFLSNLI